MSDKTKLLPCPFCQCAVLTLCDGLIPRGEYWWGCDNCKARSPICDNEAEAIAAWNRRALPDRDELLSAMSAGMFATSGGGDIMSGLEDGVDRIMALLEGSK
jgi:hypothetical protein